MPPPPILKVSEIFASIQGEGLRQGEPTIFVRLAGCNLRCSFCDTKYARRRGQDFSLEKIIDRISGIRAHFPARWVCLTGGEPLLQSVERLVRKLKAENLMVQVETNGTRFRSMPVDWYSVSPKPERYSYRSEYRKKAKEVKLIVTRKLDLALVMKLRNEFSSPIPVLLQIESGRKWSIERGLKILEEATREGLENVRLSSQLHRIFGLK
jgi:7-carboxy-7-deazaguanine synthase